MKRILFLVLILILLSSIVWSTPRTQFTGHNWIVWTRETKDVFVYGFITAVLFERAMHLLDLDPYRGQIPYGLVVAKVDVFYRENPNKKDELADIHVYFALREIHEAIYLQDKESEENKGL